MVKNIKNQSQVYHYDVNTKKLASNNFKHIFKYININRKSLIGIVFSLMLFLLISCGTKEQENQSSVSVSGIGTVFAQPDMVQMTVNFSHIAPTTKAAKKAVEETMQRILKILQGENIEDKFIKTVSLNYNMEYDYRKGYRVLIGQRAQQTIVVTVNDIINTPERFSSLLDKITAIDKIEVQDIQFDIENKAELFKQSRELAYQKAFEKASQYAALSKRKIGKVLTISEGISRDVAYPRMFMNNQNFRVPMPMAAEAAEDGGGSSVPTGERGVTSEINITFSLE